MIHKKTIAFFDLDHTLLKVNSSFLFGRYLYRNNKLSKLSIVQLAFYYLFYKIGFVTLEQLHLFSFSFVKGKNESEYKKYADEFVEKFFHKIVSKKVENIFHQYKKQGAYTVIISSSPSFLVESFKNYFNPDYIFATIYETNRNFEFTKLALICDGKTKSEYVKDLSKKLSIKIEDTYGYSDSIDDLIFLESVGHSITINPSSSLRKHSLKNNWDIFDL